MNCYLPSGPSSRIPDAKLFFFFIFIFIFLVEGFFCLSFHVVLVIHKWRKKDIIFDCVCFVFLDMVQNEQTAFNLKLRLLNKSRVLSL